MLELRLLLLVCFFHFWLVSPQSTFTCNVLTDPGSTSFASQCSNFSMFYSKDSLSLPYVLCLSTSNDKFLLLDTSANLLHNLSPEKSRNFSSSDRCLQKIGSTELVCSNGKDLIKWEAFTASVITVFYGSSNDANIQEIDTVSTTLPSLIITKDQSSNIRIVDMDLGVQNFSISADSFIKIKDDLIAFELSNKTIQIYSLSSLKVVYEASLDLDQAFYLATDELSGILGRKGNVMYIWEYLNSNSARQITTFSNNVTTMKLVNQKYVILEFSDSSIQIWSPNKNELSAIESDSLSPQIILNEKSDLAWIQSYNSYFYNLSSQSFKTFFPSNASILNYAIFENSYAITIKNDLSLQKWDFSTCDPYSIFQNPEFNISYAFDMEEDSTKLGILNNNGKTIVIYSLLDLSLSKYSFSELDNQQCTKSIKIPYYNLDEVLVLQCYKTVEGYSIFNLFLAYLNFNSLVKAPIGDFNCTIRSMIYLQMEDYIAFECGGQIYIYSILNFNLVSNFSHSQSSFNGLFSMKNSPNILGSSSDNDIEVRDIFTGIIQQTISNSNYTINGCISLNSSNSLIACFAKHITNQTSSIKIWSIQSASLITTIEDPDYGSNPILTYISMKTVELDQKYIMVASNLKVDFYELNSYSIVRSKKITRSSTNLLQALSGSTAIFDLTPSSFMLWDFSQTVPDKYPCLSNYYYDPDLGTCKQCDSSCQGNQYCVYGSSSNCISPNCYYFFSENYPNYITCLQNKQLNNIFSEANQWCINCTNVTDMCPSDFCYRCFDGYFYKEGLCTACNQNCGTCFGSTSKDCITCINSDYEKISQYECSKKKDTVRIILICVFCIFGGIIVIMLWVYVIRLYRKLNRQGDEQSPMKSEAMKLKDSELLCSESQRDYLVFLSEACDEMLASFPSKYPNEKIAHFKNFMSSLPKMIPKNFYLCKNSKDRCFEINDLYETELISAGSFGPIYLLENPSQHKFVWKVMINGPDEVAEDRIRQFRETIQRTIELRQLDISPIIGGVCCAESSSCEIGFIQEYFEYNLSKFCQKYNEDFGAKFILVKSMLALLKELDKSKYYHGNLNSFNVLVNFSEFEPNQIQIAIVDPQKYLSLSSMIRNIRRAEKPEHRFKCIPPEFFLGEDKLEFNPATEIWNIGMILYEVFYSDTNFYQMHIPWGEDLERINEEKEGHEDIDNLMRVKEIISDQIQTNKRNELVTKFTGVPIEITETINSCLQMKPKERITLGELSLKIQKAEMVNPNIKQRR